MSSLHPTTLLRRSARWLALLACNTGIGSCTAGPSGHMTMVRLSPADELLRQRVFRQAVLPP